MSNSRIVNIGNLDRRITLLSPSQSQTTSGFMKTDSWTDAGTRWANVTWTSGTEINTGDRETSKSKVIFIVRSDSTTRTIAKTWRIRYDSDDYDITAIKQHGRKDYLTIETELRE